MVFITMIFLLVISWFLVNILTKIKVNSDIAKIRINLEKEENEMKVKNYKEKLEDLKRKNVNIKFYEIKNEIEGYAELLARTKIRKIHIISMIVACTLPTILGVICNKYNHSVWSIILGVYSTPLYAWLTNVYFRNMMIDISEHIKREECKCHNINY